MKIAQIAPLFESVPPKAYGGTERVVSYLTEELIHQGHEVTLFASGDSRTGARLISHVPEALRSNKRVVDPFAHLIAQLQDVISMAEEFDLLHFHNDYVHFPFSARLSKPVITTLHGRLDLPDLIPVYSRFRDQPLISISNSQREPIPFGNWLDTIYHGLPENLYEQGSGEGDYVAFVGRICSEKGPDRAIEIAKRAGMKIRIAAKIDKADMAYFEHHFKPLLAEPHVDFVGEIGEDTKGEFLGKAKALLFPIDWPEPFGMVMIEAMACGTPVIAYPRGSVPEVIQHGENGFLVSSIDEAVIALKHIGLLDRTRVRKSFEQRFSVRIMAENYLRNYEYLCRKKIGQLRKTEIFTAMATDRPVNKLSD